MKFYRLAIAALFLSVPAAASVDLVVFPNHPAIRIPIPILNQKTDFSCGPAVMLSVLQHWGALGSGIEEEALYEPMGTTEENGTHPRMMERFAQSLGLHAEVITGLTTENLHFALAQNITVILDIQAWPEEPVEDWNTRWDDGHYVVLVGADNDFFYIMDPSLNDTPGAPPVYGAIRRSELVSRWRDWEIEDGQRVEYVRMGILISR